ncbi:right-handed parallel beta-helix repeat-containing protein [Laceyella putida]|uniref:Right-handed parallel beta-helix repeat-containing protein n=1 Tax=Laceyella putida TaxID=110101 RepID=A0ABW2RIW4_9BACL
MARIRVSRKWFAKYRNLQDAIVDATPGTTIEVEPGIYHEDLWIDRYIEIVGLGAQGDVVIQGKKLATVEMGTGYAVIKNVTIKQSRNVQAPVVLMNKGSLVLEDCHVLAGKSPAISILHDEAEPIVRRSLVFSEKNVAVQCQSMGKILFEQCELLSHGDLAVVFIAQGNPTFRKCKLTGTLGYGVFVEEAGQGQFEECNLYGFHHSPAVGIHGGNPTFLRSQIHDGKATGIVIQGGKGVFEECKCFALGKERAAVRVAGRAHPRFHHTEIKNCPGGAFLFEEEASGIVEHCDLYGFIDKPAVVIRTEAQPQFLRTRIHDGDQGAITCYHNGKGIVESCDLFGFNRAIVTVLDDGRLDLLRSKVYNGQEYGVYFAQKAEGILQETEISHFPFRGAVCVAHAADPTLIRCRISDSKVGIHVIDNGRGTFEECLVTQCEDAPWLVENGHPTIRHCRTDQPLSSPKPSDQAAADEEPLQALYAEWAHVIGQEKVKHKMRDVIAYLDYQQDRKQLGLPLSDEMPIHAVFYGQPETGKREMARCYGRILQKMGILSTDRVTHVDGRYLVKQPGEAMLQEWRRLVNEGNGGVLLIEHLPLLTKTESALAQGQIILEQLYQMLQKREADCALIFAGDERSLKEWLAGQVWLTNLVKNHFVFTPYSPNELAMYFERFAHEEQYMIHPSAREEWLKAMNEIYRTEEGKSQLERLRRYFQKVKFNHGRRCAKLPKEKRNKEMLVTFLPEDFVMTEDTDIRPENPAWLSEIERFLH